MFTGIIEGLGIIEAMRSAGQGKRLTIEADFVLDQTKIGDSIAVNGACLTVVKISGKSLKRIFLPRRWQCPLLTKQSGVTV